MILQEKFLDLVLDTLEGYRANNLGRQLQLQQSIETELLQMLVVHRYSLRNSIVTRRFGMFDALSSNILLRTEILPLDWA